MGAIDLAHAADAEQRANRVGAEALADQRARGMIEHGRPATAAAGTLMKPARRSFVRQQRFDLAPQDVIAGAGLGQKRRTLLGGRAPAPRDTDPRSAASGQASSRSRLAAPAAATVRHLPVALDRVARDLQRFRRLLDTRARRRTASPPPGSCARRPPPAPSARRRAPRDLRRARRDTISASSSDSSSRRRRASGSRASARVDENPPHQSRRHREEVRAVLPMHLLHFDEPEVRLVDERRRLQRVAGSLTAHVVAGDAPQFLIDERQQRVERVGIPLVPGQEQRRRGRCLSECADSMPSLHLFAGHSRLSRQEASCRAEREQ